MQIIKNTHTPVPKTPYSVDETYIKIMAINILIAAAAVAIVESWNA